MAKKQQFDVQTLLKHHYWIVASLGGLALPVFWYVAVGGLADDFLKGKSARDGVRQQVDGFQTGSQPNQEINDELQKREGRLKDEVYKAWKFQWDRQQSAMHWDLENMWNKPLLATLAAREPQAPQAFEDARLKGTEIPVHLRSAYAGWLGDPRDLPEEYAERAVQFRHVYPRIQLRRPIVPKEEEREKEKEKGREGAAKGKVPDIKGRGEQFGKVGGEWGGGENRRERGAAVQHEGLVYWPESERQYLESKFGKGAAWTRAPSTAQVVYTHESMNVYAMLLYYVVAQTNGEQTEHQLLAIKEIVTIRLGEDCQLPAKGSAQADPAGAGGAVGGPGNVAAGGLVPGMGQPGGGRDKGQDPFTPFAVGPLGGGGGRQGGGEEVAGGGGGGRRADGPTPPDGRHRYVDDEGFAVADPKAQPYAEFRMLPVIMRFVMDQRRLPEVLANCVQSPLPIEVKQLNMRDPRGSGGDGKRGGAKAGPAAGAKKEAAFDGGAAGGIRPKQGAEGGGGGEVFGGEIELGPYDQEIEIKGLIYIYNPPDLAKVGKGAEAPADKVPGDKKPGEKTTGDKAPGDASAKTSASPDEATKKTPPEKSAPAKSETEKAGAEKAAEPSPKTLPPKTVPSPADGAKSPPAKSS